MNEILIRANENNEKKYLLDFVKTHHHLAKRFMPHSHLMILILNELLATKHPFDDKENEKALLPGHLSSNRELCGYYMETH